MVYLEFNSEESEEYQRVKTKTLYNLDNVSGSRGGTEFINALKWVNELRLMCNHGPRNPKETQKVEAPQPAWSLQEAQARFDQLDGVGLAKCSNSACLQDLSSALSSETGAEHEDEPYISKSLELWCSLCFKGHGNTVTKVFRVCNHLPRRSQEQDERNENDKTSFDTGFSGSSSLTAFKKDDRLPTKLKRLLQDLLETPEEIKRYAVILLSGIENVLIINLASSSPPGPRLLTLFSPCFGPILSAASASTAPFQPTAALMSSVSSARSPASASSLPPYLAAVLGST